MLTQVGQVGVYEMCRSYVKLIILNKLEMHNNCKKSIEFEKRK